MEGEMEGGREGEGGRDEGKLKRSSINREGCIILYTDFNLFYLQLAGGFPYDVIMMSSAGLGIPEMKTVLRGIYLTDYLNFRTFIAKTVSKS